MLTIRRGQYRLDWYCHQCGDDFRGWLQLPGEDRREFLRRRPHYDMTHLQEERCPRCGQSYRDPEKRDEGLSQP